MIWRDHFRWNNFWKSLSFTSSGCQGILKLSFDTQPIVDLCQNYFCSKKSKALVANLIQYYLSRVATNIGN